MTDREPRPQPPQEAAAPAPSRPRRWVGPSLFLVVIVAPVLVLILSNTESQRLEFAWWEWNAPLWLILTVTFAAGAVGTRGLAWVVRTVRRRRSRAAESPG